MGNAHGTWAERAKRIIIIAVAAAILAAAMFLCLSASASQDQPQEPAQTQEPEQAQEISGKIVLTATSGRGLDRLKDSDRTSKMEFPDGDTLRAEVAGESGDGLKIAGVYVIWDVIPGQRQVSAEGQEPVTGGFGALHDYIELTAPASSLELTVPAGSVICDILFYSEGQLPDSVQRWQPPYERADILLLPSHGDDEHLFFGGIMPYYGGELGYRVQVAYMTDHKYTELYRVHEQLDGLWTVGMTAYPCFGEFVDMYSKTYADAAAMYGEDNVERWQVELIRRFKPYVIVGHDFEGEYGHGAHRLNGTMLQKSVPDAADPSKYPDLAEKYGVWDTPKFYSHLYNRDNGVIIQWDQIILERFGGKTALDVAKEGYLCHDSQQWTSFAVRMTGYGDCRQFGLYRSTVGEDVAKNDLLENIAELQPTPVPTEEPTPEPTEEPTEEPTAKPTQGPTAVPTSAENPTASSTGTTPAPETDMPQPQMSGTPETVSPDTKTSGNRKGLIAVTVTGGALILILIGAGIYRAKKKN